MTMHADDPSLDMSWLSLTSEEFLTWIKGQQQAVSRRLIEPCKSFLPMLTIQTRELPEAEPKIWLCALAVEMNDPEEKYKALEHMGRKVCREKTFPMVVSLAAECWYSRQKQGQPTIPAGKDPKRQEGLMVSALTFDNQHCGMTVLLVERDYQSVMIPGEWGEIMIEGVEANLLAEFYRGFFREAKARLGGKL